MFAAIGQAPHWGHSSSRVSDSIIAPLLPPAMPKVGVVPEPKLVAEKLPLLAENSSNATVSISTGPDPSV
ncbi:hypothetical protein, partial [Bradyrhizobium canariense]|uniref:hypothetical protein n=1 Tax=Bradyrhizobium canariense TaxID=255045 RepID=UPI001A7E0C10